MAEADLFEQTLSQLVKQGFRRYAQNVTCDELIVKTTMMSKRINNDTLWCHVTLSITHSPQGVNSLFAEINIRSQMETGDMADLRICNVKYDTLARRMPEYEQRLIAAWAAINQEQSCTKNLTRK